MWVKVVVAVLKVMEAESLVAVVVRHRFPRIMDPILLVGRQIMAPAIHRVEVGTMGLPNRKFL